MPPSSEVGAAARVLGVEANPSITAVTAEELERQVVARRDELAGADPGRYLRLLLDHAGTAALLVDTGFARDRTLRPAELERAADRPVHEIVRLEAMAEELLQPGSPTARSLSRFLNGFEERLGTTLERGAVALKSIAAYRGGLWLFTESSLADRRRAFSGMDKAAQAQRFDDPVLLPFLVRRAAELAGPYPPVHLAPSPATPRAGRGATRLGARAPGPSRAGKPTAGPGG